jgi:hypothetical protein
MSKPRVALAVVLLLVGLVWIGQGAGLIGGSVMTGSSFWLYVGVVLVVLAAAIAWTARPKPQP